MFLDEWPGVRELSKQLWLPPITHALAIRRNRVSSVFEIVLRVQIGNNPRLNRRPSQPLLGQRAEGRLSMAKK